MRREIESVLKLVRELPAVDLPELIGALEHVRAVAFARMMSPPAIPRDELLDIGEASKRLKVSRDYLYRHHARLPFARRMGNKVLFSSNGIDLYLRKSR
jgi:hypothetical protein